MSATITTKAIRVQRTGGPEVMEYVDVELPRSEYQGLREKLQLATGSRVHLKPRRVQRFASDELPDPAAMI